MLKQGIFTDKRGISYSIYELSSKGFYRFDITRENATFHTDPNAVIFSIVRKRKTYTFGDESLYEDYKELLALSSVIKAPIEKSTEWRGGKYFAKNVQSSESQSYLNEIITCNGVTTSTTVSYGIRFITLFIANEYNEMKLDPLNFSDYTETMLDGESQVTLSTPYYPLSYLRAKYNISHIEKNDFVVADDIDTARKRLNRYASAGNCLRGFDTETTGLDVDLYGEDKLTGVILSYREDEATYFPFGHKEFPNLPMEFLDELMKVVIQHQDTTIAHNKKFDRKVMKKLGYDLQIKWDTMVLSFMVNPVIARGAHSEKDLIYRLEGRKYLELDEIFISEKNIDFSVLPKDIVKVYACPDGCNVIKLYKHLINELPKYSRNLYEIESRLADIKADQEYYGLKVNVEEFIKNFDNCEYMIDKLVRMFRQMTRIDGNIDSPAVLSNLIYDRMRCDVLMRTKTGKPSTSSKAITKLAHQKKTDKSENGISEDIVDKFGKVVIKASEFNTSKYPVLLVLEKYRKYQKLKTAFYARFERTVKHGRIFFWINQNGAASGRQSSPMHQLPPELKGVIVADDNRAMWDPDYSQMELRMIAFLAKEKDLIKLCEDPEVDIHRAIGSLISGKEMYAISDKERKVGKSRNFGVVYLISAYGLANQMFGAGANQKKEYVDKAQESLDEFYHRFKRIRAYIAQNATNVRKNGYITTFFGRNRYFKEIFDPDVSSRKKASLIRQANNTPVQGSSADYLKIAEVNFDNWIREKGWNEIMPDGFPRVRLALTIHDEAIIMADKSIPYEEIVEMITRCMDMPIKDAPPFFVQPTLVSTWADHDDSRLAMPIKLRDKLIEDYHKTGVSILNEENYLDTLVNYQTAQLEGYMSEMIAKYGPNPDDVAANIKHPTLTHSLLEAYTPKDARDLDHMDKIVAATHAYMEGVNVEQIIHQAPKQEALDDERLFGELDSLVNFDKDGNVIYEFAEDENELDYALPTADEERYINEMAKGEIVKVWELGDAICVDIDNLTEESSNRVIQEVWKYKDPDGFFKVIFYYNGSLLDAGFRVEDLPKEEITNLIQSLH